ncbi:MAG: TrkA family potassium uptake protein, partial [Bacilli bacterium]
MSKKSYAVIGLGQFGRAVVEELVANSADVIAIDNDEDVVKKVAVLLPTAFVADSTDEEALKELGVQDVDAAIIAFGGNKEAAVLTTVILRDLGIKQIIVRSDDNYFVPIMKKLGATEVITPQKAAGIALANRLGNEDFKDFYKLDNQHSVISLMVNPGFIPTTIME